jgi:predicted DNA-binding antitoxin AbrB/MazE fold protein
MPTLIHAIFENGVFRPTQPVNLPDHSEVELELRPVGAGHPASPANGEPPSLDEVYAILGKRFNSGDPDLSASPPATWDQVFADKLTIDAGDGGDDCQVTTDDLLF